eukprot:TRINITY_DN51_c4_g1_i2.p1 TRINITY_DN51_c4_g1~~TRINITY_DN51_c4_g1_i2.p1  ORF type:complete len:2678 (+),score=278.13 TRINITY_DN51_c4_g1_i2:23-8035(+)
MSYERGEGSNRGGRGGRGRGRGVGRGERYEGQTGENQDQWSRGRGSNRGGRGSSDDRVGRGGASQGGRGNHQNQKSRRSDDEDNKSRDNTYYRNKNNNNNNKSSDNRNNHKNNHNNNSNYNNDNNNNKQNRILEEMIEGEDAVRAVHNSSNNNHSDNRNNHKNNNNKNNNYYNNNNNNNNGGNRGGGRGGRGGRGGGRGRGSGNYYNSVQLPTHYQPDNKVDEHIIKFISHCKDKTGKQLSTAIKQQNETWLNCFKYAQHLPMRSLEQLIQILAKISKLDNDVSPPEIEYVTDAMKRLVNSATKDRTNIIVIAEALILAIERLCEFRWSIPRENVEDSLKSIIKEVHRSLDVTDSDHALIMQKLLKLLDEIKKPWKIKTEEETEDIQSESNTQELDGSWKNADVKWLLDVNRFVPALLPQMEKVYESKTKYFDTTERLWTGMTMYDGWAALNPSCRQKVNEAKGTCGRALWPMATGYKCWTKNCTNTTERNCSMHRSFGLCSECVKKSQVSMRGPPGKRASTNIYDGYVDYSDYEGRIYISQVQSRNAPQHQIHWFSSTRLQVTNLVGIVKLEKRAGQMSLSSKIFWAEIVQHDRNEHPFQEGKRREKGCLAVTLLEGQGGLDLAELGLHRGDPLGMIDCKAFVPEHIPVLVALEEQKKTSLPFNDGALLNIGQCDITKESDANENETILTEDDITRDQISRDIYTMVKESQLDPLVQIRSYPDRTTVSKLHRKLVDLVKKATLDSCQMKSFLAALTHKVHTTQGPPGTGKSYLGVAIVRALLIIRNTWIKINPSVNEPPVLVLSYKNHAIDEFISDLIHADPEHVMRPSELIRVGACNIPNLIPYSESRAVQDHREVRQRIDDLKRIHGIRDKLTKLNKERSNILVCSADSFQEESSDGKDDLVVNLTNILGRHELLLDHRKPKGTYIMEDFKPLLEVKLEIKQVPQLYNKVAHYPSICVEEILWQFMNGNHPLPQCKFTFNDGQCTELSDYTFHNYCSKHLCTFNEKDPKTRCENPRVPTKLFCVNHACGAEDCDLQSLPSPQRFCANHICFKCLERKLVSKIAQSNPPRNTCEDHPLCCQMSCRELAVTGNYCNEHTVSQFCKGITRKKKKPCRSKAISNSVPYCLVHKEQAPKPKANVDRTKESESRTDKCAATTNKGNPCKQVALPDMLYCNDHLQKWNQTAHQNPTPNENEPPNQNEKTNQTSAGKTEVDTNRRKHDKEDQDEVKLSGKKDRDDKESGSVNGAKDKENVEDEESDGDEVVDEPTQDNYDEVDYEDLPESLQHKDEVLGKDDDFEVEELVGAQEIGEEVEEDGTQFIPPSEWTWDMDLVSRWDAIHSIIPKEKNLCLTMWEELTRISKSSYKKYKEARVKANAVVYERKKVIGGTIVGCIKRLDAIRATSPFAILIEEASEVQEPLLFSCLVQSTCKLELIGDHRQLRPTLSNKYDFERINRMNISMFERLIESKDGTPSNVLSVQRRMRRDICDLTRGFYADITEITDHPRCFHRTILNKSIMKEWEGNGREIPGVSPHVFFWCHSGTQTKSTKGLSKENKTEAVMVTALAKYLVSECSIPESSIVILTPYKGQLMLLKTMLESKKLIDKTNKTGCRLSTVDRFQGDEGDVVIISLVIDSKAQTPFVKLQNRMIVLLSRARLGMYIIGNAQYFEKNPSEHWSKTFDLLMQPGTNDSTKLGPPTKPIPSPLAQLLLGIPNSKPQNTEESAFDDHLVYKEKRIGPGLPICCPQHRDSTKLITDPNDLNLDFCKVLCTHKLPCSHICGLSCHFPKLDQHKSDCKEFFDSPCADHPDLVPCSLVMSFKNANSSHPMENYRCQQLVEVQLPCTHKHTFPCADAKDYIQGKLPWPRCHKPGLTPFVYSKCKHEKNLKCYKLIEAQKDPLSHELNYPCNQQVHYFPPCGHETIINCYVKQQYESKESDFPCSKQVQKQLPRCGHNATIPCPTEISIRWWTGVACDTPGIVEEKKNYGPKDYTCKQTATFVRRCGHKEQVNCEKAFEMAKSDTQCSVVVEKANPACGHICKIPCYEYQKLVHLIPPPPVKEVDEQDPLKYYLELDRHPVTCQHPVTLSRRCSHKDQVTCHEARTNSTQCQHNINIKNPMCGHEISIPCDTVDLFRTWSPWPADTDKQEWNSALMNKGILYEKGAPVPVLPPSSVRNLLKVCTKEKIIVRKNDSCGHDVTLSCNDAFQKVFPSLSKKKVGAIKCYEDIVGKLQFCDHKRKFKCDAYDRYLQDPSKQPCKEKVDVECWNFSVCKKKLNMECSSSSKQLVTCDSNTDWQCKKGHKFTVPLCKYGIPQACPECLLIEVYALCSREYDEKELSIKLPDFLQPFKSECNTVNVNFQEIQRSKQGVINRYYNRAENLEPWDRPLFLPKLVPFFAVLPQASNRVTDLWKRANETRCGFAIETSLWTHQSLTNLKQMIRNKSVVLLIGYGYTCSTLVNPNLPNKRKKQWNEKNLHIYDSVQMGDQLYFLPPFCCYATHKMNVTQDVLTKLLAQSLPRPISLDQQFITYQLPNGTATQATTSQAPPQAYHDMQKIIAKTIASGVSIVTSWDGKSLHSSSSIQRTLESKLEFAKDALRPKIDPPFLAGSEYLKTLLKDDSSSSSVFMLLLSLEQDYHGFEKEAQENLNQYMEQIKKNERGSTSPVITRFSENF